MSQFLEGLFSLQGHVAVVTGASSGMGLTMADTFARAGAQVVLVARNEARLRAESERLTAAGFVAAHVAADLGERASLPFAMDAMEKHYGAPDIVVHAAGINLR